MPIHGDTQIDLKTEKRRCGQGTQQKKKKIENQEEKKPEVKILGKCLSGVIASAHSWGHPDRLELKREVWSKDKAKEIRK